MNSPPRHWITLFLCSKPSICHPISLRLTVQGLFPQAHLRSHFLLFLPLSYSIPVIFVSSLPLVHTKHALLASKPLHWMFPLTVPFFLPPSKGLCSNMAFSVRTSLTTSSQFTVPSSILAVCDLFLLYFFPKHKFLSDILCILHFKNLCSITLYYKLYEQLICFVHQFCSPNA